MTTVDQAQDKVLLTNQKIGSVVNDFKVLTEARITFNNTRLVAYVNLLYQRSNFLYLRFLFHHSPSFIGVLIAIWGVIVAIYNGIKFIIDLLHIKELLVLIDILTIIWPEFRKKITAIYGKISEFSAQIGWGADGLSHLIQSAQGGLNLIGGFLGKDESWLQISGADRVVGAMERLSAWSALITKDPGNLLDLLFRSQSNITMREQKKWWGDTMTWLENTAKEAKLAIQKVNDTIGNLLELENKMPAFVRDNIPSWVSDGITWVDTQIDNTILPALTEITNEFIQINAQLEAERQRAADLAEQLSRPGDLLERVKMLHESEREDQQRKMDDAVSAQFVRDTESKKNQNAGIIAKLQAITDALRDAPPALVFLDLEGMKRSIIKTPAGNIYGSWNIEDFVAE